MYSTHSTRSGVGLDGLFQWGDHVCHFFRSADVLGEILVPFFKAGLERNESCVWITGHPYGKERALSEMRAAVSDFDRRTNCGQIRIFGQDEWYAKQKLMSTTDKVRCWLSQKDEAVGLGYAGLRASGNSSFLDKGAWDDFLKYEQAVNEAFKDQRIIGLCSYPMEGCSAHSVLNVTHCHKHSLAKRDGQWDLIEVRRHDSGAFQALAGQGHTVQRVIEDQLAIFIEAFPERIALQGNHVQLSGAEATKLGILLNELVTNAAKHGALSSVQGELDVQWHLVGNGTRSLRIKWTESGMASLTIPDSIGTGTALIAGLVHNWVRSFYTTGVVSTFDLSLA